MKRLLILFLIVTVFCFTGCISLFKRSTTESADRLNDKANEMQSKKDALSVNNDKKLNQIGILAAGTHHALDQEKDPSKEVQVAKELNERVVSIAGNPEINDLKRIQKIVDDLISAVKIEREKGRAELNKLDKEIQYLQSERSKLKSQLDKTSKEYQALSSEIAEKNDENTQKVNELDKWFGLGAIFYGVKKFITSLLVGILIFAVMFFILKLAAMSNPIAAFIFKIFEFIGSSILFLIKSITPKSFTMSNFVDKQHYDKYKVTLDKIVDTIQDMKNKNKMLSDDKKYTLEDLFENLSKVLDEKDKDAVKECLKEMNWKI